MTPARLARLRAALDRRQPDLTVVMDRTQKSHNIAAVMRTADAVGLYRVHAIATDPIRSHHRICAGVRKWVHVERHATLGECLRSLLDEGFRLLVATRSEQAVDYRHVDYRRPTAIVLGTELYGVDSQAVAAATEQVQIPMQGLGESLNVSVAAALILYEARRQREAAGRYATPSRLPPAEYERTLFEWAYPDIARRCRERRLPYPGLREDGQLAANPFAGAARGGDAPGPHRGGARPRQESADARRDGADARRDGAGAARDGAGGRREIHSSRRHGGREAR